MVAENPTWGAPRIHGELLKLGFDLSEPTVSRWVRRARMVKKLIFASEEGGVPDRRLMPLPAHSTSADHPVVPCNAQFRCARSPLDAAMRTGAGSACPGDCAPRGNVPRIAAGVRCFDE